MRIAATILRQHVELAAFLWAQRDTLAAADPPDSGAIAGTEARLEANLDALAIAGDSAWPFIIEQFETYPEKGELFVAAVHAISGEDGRRVTQVVNFARGAADDRGFVGALAWLRPPAMRELVREWARSADGFCRYLAASAFVQHKADPKQLLPGLLRDADPRVRRQGFRLAGLVRRADLARSLHDGLDDPDPEARFWAAWSCVEIGQTRTALEALKAAVAARAPNADAAMRSVLAALAEREGRQWLGELAAAPETRPLAVRGLGVIGGAEALPWLIGCMQVASTAVAAGGAFLEVWGAIEDPDDYFYPDAETAAAALGPDVAAAPGRIPIAAQFELLFRSKGDAGRTANDLR